LLTPDPQTDPPVFTPPPPEPPPLEREVVGQPESPQPVSVMATISAIINKRVLLVVVMQILRGMPHNLGNLQVALLRAW
jgi:hypothetical protein